MFTNTFDFGYEIYPCTFNDGNDDGIGDLIGIKEKIPYLSELGIKAVWICPIYLSPGVDCGYDVADYYQIDPMYGTNDDLSNLIEVAHQYGIKIFLDIVPNHTSDQHELFQKALADKNAPERELFIFKDPKPDGSIPNNWLSVFGGSAWKYHEPTGQYYLHLFYPEQPDMNWRNPKVHELFEDILRYWFIKGIDGFRIDVSQGLYKHADFPDADLINPNLSSNAGVQDQFKNLDDVLYYCLPETPKVFEKWKQIANEYGATMIGEMPSTTKERLMPYLADTCMDTVTYLASCWTPWDPEYLIQIFKDGETEFRNKITWMISNHDNRRAATRFGGGKVGLNRSLAATAFTAFLTGFPFLYQGEELGLEDIEVEHENLRDPMGREFPDDPDTGRDPCRTNMPWQSGEKWQGFSDHDQPWLTSKPRKDIDCVDVQLGDDNSNYYQCKKIVNLRSTIYKEIFENKYEQKYFESKTHYGYEAGPYLIAFNAGKEDVVHSVEGNWTKCYCSDLVMNDASTHSGSVVFNSESTTVYKKS